MVMLILTLTLLPITPTIAVGPKPRGKADVELIGGISGSASNFDVGLHGKLTIVYGDVDLTFVKPYEEEDWWQNFDNEGEGRLGIRIDERTEEVHIIYMFDKYEETGYKKYQLETYGTFSGSIPYVTVFVANEEFEIYQIVSQRSSKKNGKGAIGVTYVSVFPEEVELKITFTITIIEG